MGSEQEMIMSTTEMVFSLRQLQEKSRELRKPLYQERMVYCLYRLNQGLQSSQHSPEEDWMPPKLLRMITSFHEDMQGIFQYGGSTSDPVKS